MINLNFRTLSHFNQCQLFNWTKLTEKDQPGQQKVPVFDDKGKQFDNKQLTSIWKVY
jgi:hypothetical protein